MLLLQVLRTTGTRHFLLATAFMLVAYPLIQSFGNVWIWVQVTEPLALLFYPLFSVLFGLVVMLQVHRLSKKTCAPLTAAGTFTGLIGACPSCMLLLGLFLPLDFLAVLSSYATYLVLASIALLVLSLYALGGFSSRD